MNTETPTSTSTSTPRNGHDADTVQWPDPSPLQEWWTEVMEGALMPSSRPAA
ncbi:hypothetical protein ACQP2U_07335 [Nocardia sp. CA-084685]|uniref:hypothetical protein n=1 Tax=Nocardia sp. CA-084685 TaxID=3239970 RepID=UPI003D985328